MNSLEVIYEDNHLLAVNKKSGDIVQGDKTGDQPLNEIAKEYLKVKYNKPGNVYLGTVHRIDRPVSGIVLFAKTDKALSRLNKLFQSRDIKKTYWAVVKNKPENEIQHLTHYLIKNQANNKSKAFKKEVKYSKKSMLSYKLVFKLQSYYMLEVHPETGRHHQIRVQLAAIGSPIKGDIKYGFDRPNKDASIHLHARKIEFIHPVSKAPMTIVAPPPIDPIWKACENSVTE